MKLGRAVGDIERTIRRILTTFDHDITVQDNFGPSGVEAGSIIVSRGATQTPQWQTPADFVKAHPELKGEDGKDGVDGAPGGPGPPGAAGSSASFDKIMTADFGSGTEIMFDHVGNVMYIE